MSGFLMTAIVGQVLAVNRPAGLVRCGLRLPGGGRAAADVETTDPVAPGDRLEALLGPLGPTTRWGAAEVPLLDARGGVQCPSNIYGHLAVLCALKVLLGRSGRPNVGVVAFTRLGPHLAETAERFLPVAERLVPHLAPSLASFGKVGKLLAEHGSDAPRALSALRQNAQDDLAALIPALAPTRVLRAALKEQGVPSTLTSQMDADMAAVLRATTIWLRARAIPVGLVSFAPESRT